MAGPKQRNVDLAAAAYAAGQSIADVAKVANCSERAVYKWAKKASFLRRVREIRGAMIETAANRLAATMARAAEVLEELLVSEDASERRHAATRIIELGLRTTEQLDLVERIAAIEQRLNCGEYSSEAHSGAT